MQLIHLADHAAAALLLTAVAAGLSLIVLLGLPRRHRPRHWLVCVAATVAAGIALTGRSALAGIPDPFVATFPVLCLATALSGWTDGDTPRRARLAMAGAAILLPAAGAVTVEIIPAELPNLAAACGSLFLLGAAYGLWRRPEREGRNLYHIAAAWLALAAVVGLADATRGSDALSTVPALLLLATVGAVPAIAGLASLRDQNSLLRFKAAEGAERLRDLAGLGADWTWESDAGHRLRHLSPRDGAEVAAPELAPGLPPSAPHDGPIDDPKWRAHLAELPEHRPFSDFIHAVTLPGLGERTLRISGWPRFDETGRFRGYRGTANDITEMVETRATAETLRLQLEAAVSSLPDGFALFDAEDRLVICNNAFRRIGPTMSRIMRPGARFESILRAAIADGLFDLEGRDADTFVAECMARHREAPYRIELNDAEGHVVQVSVTRTPDGGSVLLWTDVSAHVRREQVLSILVESRTRGRDLLEAAAEALQTGLGYRWAAIGRRSKDSERSELLAFWDGKLPGPVTPFSYELKGTPCDQVYAGDPHCIWPRDVARHFPDDRMLVQMGAEAYRGRLLLDGEGKALGYIFVLHDEPREPRPADEEIVELVANAVAIELQRLELARERDQSADLLEVIFKNVGAGIAVFDRNLELIGHNERFRTMLELPQALLADGGYEAMVRYAAERGAFGAGEVDSIVRERVDLARQPKPRQFELKRLSGQTIEFHSDPLPGGGFVTTCSDVTERRRMEDAIRSNELRYRMISEMTSDLLYSFRIDDDRKLASEWFAGSLGDVSIDLDDHGAPGSAWRAWIGRFQPGDQELLSEREQRLLSGESSIDEVRMRLDDGRTIWVRLHGRPQIEPETGRVVRIFGAAQDITERMESEFQLRSAKEAAELANRAKSEFLATMSHELRTPLNAVIGFSEIMTEELIGPLGDPRYRSYAQDIRESGAHLLEIINDILDVSKAEAGMLELAEEQVDLSHAIATSLRLVSQRAERGGVRLAETLPDGLPPVLVDARRLKQILLNLLSNAVKFTPAGGLVSIDAGRDADGWLHVRIADTGIGIAPGDLERVLEPFTQVDSGFNRRHEGTGLGLPLTKALVELHGGRLELARNEVGGTDAVVRLPPHRIMPPAARQPTSAGGN